MVGRTGEGMLMGMMAMGWALAAVPKPGEVVLRTGFDTPQEREAWSRADFARWVPGYQGTISLQVTVPPERAEGGNMIRLPLDLTPYRGCRLLFEGLAKAENVTKPSQPWLGVKFMLHYLSPTSGPFWHNENDVYGTFD